MTPRLLQTSYRQNIIKNFSGGVNCRDGLSQVADGQLTDVKNVWYKDGVVKQRPAFRCAEKLGETWEWENDFIASNEARGRKVYVKKESFKVLAGKTYVLVVIQHKDRLDFRYYASAEDYIKLGTVTDIPKTDFTCNVFKFKDDIYCFCSGYYPDEATPFYIIKGVEDEKATQYTVNFSRITDVANDVYTPTIFTNGLPNSPYTSGTNFEGYNLLSPYAKFYFSSSRPDSEATGLFFSNFYLPKTPTVGSMVKVNFTHWDGKIVTHSVTLQNETSADGKTLNIVGYEDAKITNSGTTSARFDTEDNLSLMVVNNCVSFVFVNNVKAQSGSDNIEVHSEDGSTFILNNVEIVADMGTTEEGYRKILDMTFNEWFGGSAEGIYGGIHLFMGGNKNANDIGLVCWSDFNKPLFFSGNGYTYAGDTSQRVTAFSKQGEQLLILKERETYATRYVSASDVISQEATTSQSVIDVTSAEVTFPMILVHGFIGCDCPNTVQLCRNRTVWAHSDGKVYTISSASQWNERSIFEISAMVERRIKRYSAEQMRNAVSADWEGHYILSIGDEFFVMDYNSYGYAHISSYKKDEDAQRNIPWWIWEKPTYNRSVYSSAERTETTVPENLNLQGLVTVGDKCIAIGLFEAEWKEQGSAYMLEVLDVAEGLDRLPLLTYTENGKYRQTEDFSISTMIQTKLFDFGVPSYVKNVPKAEITLGNNGGEPIRVTFITDNGADFETIVLESSETNIFGAKFFSSVCLRNRNRLNKRIGYRIESDGEIFVDSMLVYYQILGGTK